MLDTCASPLGGKKICPCKHLQRACRGCVSQVLDTVPDFSPTANEHGEFEDGNARQRRASQRSEASIEGHVPPAPHTLARSKPGSACNMDAICSD